MAAQKGLTSATMRYSAVQSALSFLGPVMWAWLAVDLVRAAVGTDYARVVRAVYILAQVGRGLGCLLHDQAEEWVSPHNAVGGGHVDRGHFSGGRAVCG